MHPNRFAACSPHDLSDLAAGHPLAWICSAGPNGLMATPLPLRLKHGEDGGLLAVEGHFAIANPHVAALRADPQALVLWLGVQGYVSPSWMADRTQAPSWNYASAQCRVAVRFEDGAEADEYATLRHLRALACEHEAGRPEAWSVDEMGPRLQQLAQRVVSFRAEVLALHERYKLGQDERDDVFADILAGLGGSAQAPLAEWMRRFNPGRGPAATVNDPRDADAAPPPA